MTITDDRSTPPAPAPTPPSYFRRHPILSGFGVLSGLSLFSALWPFSAIVIAVAVAGHATGLDRAAWSLAERLATRAMKTARHRGPEPVVPVAPVAPEPHRPAPEGPEPSAPAPSAPRREAHAPATAAPRALRAPQAHAPTTQRAARSRRPQIAQHRVGSGIDGPGS